MSAPSSRRCVLLAASTLSIMGLLSGCTTLGGNVKGSFSCQAPNGVCAPSSVIDDRALAMISSEAGDVTVPAGPYVPGPAKPRATKAAIVAAAAPPPGQPEGARTQDRVLRIVFMPYVDDRGRLHEASAVHAVVSQSEWKQQAIASATPLPVAGKGPTLAEAVDQASLAYDYAAIDPNLPDSAVAAAARKNGPDPIAQLKAEVAGKLGSAKPRPIAPRAMQEMVSLAAPREPAPRAPLPAVTAAGAQAVASVRSSAAVQAAASQAQQLAAQGAQGAAPAPTGTARPVVKAASFPGVEGN